MRVGARRLAARPDPRRHGAATSRAARRARRASRLDALRSLGGPGRIATVCARRVVVLRSACRVGEAPAARRAPLHDLPRAASRPPVPLVVTVHDLAVLRHPSLPALDAALRPLRACPGSRGRRAGSSPSPSSRSASSSSCSASPPERVTVIAERRRDGLHARRAGRRGRLRARRRDARAAQEPRAASARRRASPASSCASSARAAGAASRPPGWLGRVADEELARLYRGARCLVFPSLYEGFGIPVLEAMACGTPVVTSRGGATEEVAGGAAVLVDPLDVGCDRGRASHEAVARRDELRRARPRARARASRGTRRRARPSTSIGRLPRERSSSSTRTCSAAGARATRRTSSTCCASCPRRRASGLRFAARHAPARSRPRRHRGGASCRRASQELRMAWSLPRAAAPPAAPRSPTSSTRCRSRCPCPAVVTIHDLSFERDPSLMPPHDRLRLPDRSCRARPGAPRAC